MYSQMSKGIFLFFPLRIHILYKIPYIYMLQMQVTFFGARIFFIGHLPRKGFNYVQLIRSDGTPPTQAPPSNSGCPLPFPLPALPFQSTSRRLRIVRLDMR